MGARLQISLDLGLSHVEVLVEADGVRLPDGQLLRWQVLQEINKAENNCFLIEDGQAHKIITYSETTGRVYSLMPTRGAPTMLVSGIPMHRIKDSDPYRDTLEKIKTVQPVNGEVLDTATGLGYTAIQAARTARSVLTIELDPAALEIARLNPWSQALFDNPRISQRIGDSYDVIQELESACFTRIIHDPPAFSLAGDLYSGEFYAQLYRVLKPGGRLFHYIGNPESKSGHNITRSVKGRLREAGFSRVADQPRAFGVLAIKS